MTAPYPTSAPGAIVAGDDDTTKTDQPGQPQFNPYGTPATPGYPQYSVQYTATTTGQPVLNPYGPPPGQPVINLYNPTGQPTVPQYVPPPAYGTGMPPMYQVPYGAPITTQPGHQEQIQWMPAPTQSIPNCPPGLEYLSTIDQLLVKQQIEVLELLTGFETANKYRVLNSMGQSLYFAVEDSEDFTRQCFGSLRLFDLKIIDNLGNEVIHFFRPFRCDSCCYPYFLQKMEVTAPVGEVIGYVTQLWSMSKQYFQIENASGEPVLKIVGPFCTFTCGSDVIFQVLSNDEKTEVGTIRKQWTGLLVEHATDADNFGITFPVDLDVQMKAVMLGACFLIDFMFYEKRANRDNRHRRRL